MQQTHFVTSFVYLFLYYKPSAYRRHNFKMNWLAGLETFFKLGTVFLGCPSTIIYIVRHKIEAPVALMAGQDVKIS